MLSPAFDKSKFLLKFFLRFLIMIIQVSLYLFLSSGIELKLHNIPVTLKLVRKVIANFHYSEVSGFLCIPVVVLKNCEPELSYVLAEYFNLCLNESWCPDFWKFLSVAAIFKNIWETTSTKNYRPVGLLFVVNEFFEKLVNNMRIDHLEKFGFFLISSMVSGLLIQPHTFWKLYLIELLGLLLGAGLVKP